MSDTNDQALRDAFRDRIADLGNPGAIIIGYTAAVEVVTADEDGPWLKTLNDKQSTPWASVGRVAALDQILRHDLQSGWSQDCEDDE